MKTIHRFSISTAALLVGLGTMPALAQTADQNLAVTGNNGVTTDMLPSSTVDQMGSNNVDQENAIEQGLKSGQLTPEEAARLQAHEARIEQIESHDINSADNNSGALTTNEQTRLDQAENAQNNRINTLETNNVTADPSSTDSTRMTNDIQRNINQQNHIVQGVNNGQITDAEAGTLENGQARADRTEARLGDDGNVTAADQHRIRIVENFQRNDIRNDRNNGTNASGTPNTVITTQGTTQGTLNGGSVPVTANSPNAVNVNAGNSVPLTQASTMNNAQVNASTPSLNSGSSAAVNAGPATVVNGTAVHTTPMAPVVMPHPIAAHR